jgi:hypothetical protein
VETCRRAGRFPTDAHATGLYAATRHLIFTVAYLVLRPTFTDAHAREHANDIACNRVDRLMSHEMLALWVFNEPAAGDKTPSNYVRMCAKRRAFTVKDSAKHMEVDRVMSLDQPVKDARNAQDPGSGALIQVKSLDLSPERTALGRQAKELLLRHGFTEIQIALISATIELKNYMALGHASSVSDASRQKATLLAAARSLLTR